MPSKNTKLALNLFLLVAGMLMLTAASVPLYRLFCASTGLAGTTQRASHAPAKALNRDITIDFNADIAPGMPWDFHPAERRIRIKIGQQALTHYVAHNRSDTPVTGRAVYNVTPFEAGAYFVKIQCFCFSNQTLAAGQRADMPVLFYVDPKIIGDPDLKNIQTITLSYTFFPVKNTLEKK